jgi:hypothetical protein
LSLWGPLWQSICATLKYDKLPTCQGLRMDGSTEEISFGSIRQEKGQKRTSFPEISGGGRV